MLPPNLLIVSMVIFLTTTVSTAPVEEKEQEEVEAAEELEGELSEEEEDDDDSKSQDKIDEGLTGAQQTTTTVAVAASGGSGVSSNVQDLSASSSQSAGRGTNDGTAGNSAGHRGDSSPVNSSAAGGPISSGASQPTGSSSSLGSSAAELHGASAAQTQHTGSDGGDSESNGNGQKLLIGGGGRGRDDSQTGVLGLFGLGASHLDHTGECPGGGDPFKPGVHINLPGDMTPPTQLDSTVISLSVTAAASSHQNSGSSLDSPADPAHQPDISIDQSGPGHASLSSGPEQSLSSFVSTSSYSAAHRDGVDPPDVNGNGRQILLTDVNTATDRLVSFNDLQTQNLRTELTGAAESVTGLHIDLTASGLGLGHDVTESLPIVLHTDTHPDLVTVAADFTGTDQVSADPTGTPLDFSHPAVTAHTQMAGSVTEQYHPSGQGPEGAENVELEDTC